MVELVDVDVDIEYDIRPVEVGARVKKSANGSSFPKKRSKSLKASSKSESLRPNPIRPNTKDGAPNPNGEARYAGAVEEDSPKSYSRLLMGSDKISYALEMALNRSSAADLFDGFLSG